MGDWGNESCAVIRKVEGTHRGGLSGPLTGRALYVQEIILQEIVILMTFFIFIVLFLM